MPHSGCLHMTGCTRSCTRNLKQASFACPFYQMDSTWVALTSTRLGILVPHWDRGRHLGLQCRNMAISAQTLHQHEADQLAGGLARVTDCTSCRISSACGQECMHHTLSVERTVCATYCLCYVLSVLRTVCATLHALHMCTYICYTQTVCNTVYATYAGWHAGGD